MIGIADRIKSELSSVANVQVSSSDGDANKMISQIQNFTAMKVDTMYIMPGDPKALTEAMRTARKNGVKIAVAGVSMGDEDDDAYDSAANVNQYLVGAYCALMVKEWIDKTYPNAPANSIETTALTNTVSEDAIHRSVGLLSIREQYLKNQDGQFVDAEGNVVNDSGKVPNPTYSNKIKIVNQTEASNFQDSQVAMENSLTSNPNVKIVICYNSDIASGASQVFADRFSKDKLAGIGVFGSDFSGNEITALREADAGAGVYRSTIMFGSADLPGDMANLTMSVFKNQNVVKKIWDPISLVSIENGKEVFTAVDSSKGVVIPPVR
jgi:ABC-type sugar transport system substrate-binding protein